MAEDPQKNILFNRQIGELLRDFSKDIDIALLDALCDAIVDYIGIVSHVKGKDPDPELKKIVSDFEYEAESISEQLKVIRSEFRDLRNEDAILLDIDLPKYDNSKYFILSIPESLHSAIKRFIKKFPKLYGRKTTVRDVVDRSILLKVSYNDNLMDNEFYQQWRLFRILDKERNAKIDWNEIMEKISVRRSHKLFTRRGEDED
jgi:hypothetical protein